MKLLSKMTREELWEFWQNFRRPSRKQAAELLGGKYPGYTSEAAALAGFACNRAVAIDCKRRGDHHGEKVYRMAADCCLEGLSVRALQRVYK